MKKSSAPIEIERGEARVGWHYCTGQVESLELVPSARPFTWIRGVFGMPYGMCYLDKREGIADGVRHVYEYMTDLRLTVTRTLTDEGYTERYVWQNVGKKAISIAEGEVGVYVTFAEQYDIRRVAIHYRAFTHCLLAGDVFYMANARFNGASDGYGLVMHEGRVAAVKEERLRPTERGDLIAFMPAGTLAPEETVAWEWTVFAYENIEAFWRFVRRFAPKIEITPLLPEAGQTVTVKVDDEVVPTVVVDGETVPNPFVAKAGAFSLVPVAERPDTVLSLSGVSHEERWASSYRGWCRARSANPRRPIADSVAYARRFALSADREDYQKAVDSLSAYYRKFGAYKMPQAFMPGVLIKSNDGLTAQFARHVTTVLRPNNRPYTADVAFAEYDMLRVADYVFEGKYRQEKDSAYLRALPLIKTPFGDLYSYTSDER